MSKNVDKARNENRPRLCVRDNSKEENYTNNLFSMGDEWMKLDTNDIPNYNDWNEWSGLLITFKKIFKDPMDLYDLAIKVSNHYLIWAFILLFKVFFKV